MKGRCQARVSLRSGNARCSFAAKEDVKLAGPLPPRILHLCVPHARILVHRGHLAPQMVERWLGPDVIIDG